MYLGVDRVMMMMSHQWNFISIFNIETLHEERDAVSHSSLYAKNLALCLAYGRSSNDVCWMDEYCPHFFPLTFSEQSAWELKCSIPTLVLKATVTKQGICVQAKCHVQRLMTPCWNPARFSTRQLQGGPHICSSFIYRVNDDAEALSTWLENH